MGILFLLVQLFWPLCYFGAMPFGLEFYLYNEMLYWVISAIVSVLIWKADKKRASYWKISLFPLTVLCCVWELLFTRTPFAVPFAIVRCACAYAFLAPLPDRWPKYLAKGIYIWLILGFIGICGFDLTFGSIGRMTVVQEAKSPSGACTAQY